jgi:hypothetical protein
VLYYTTATSSPAAKSNEAHQAMKLVGFVLLLETGNLVLERPIRLSTTKAKLLHRAPDTFKLHDNIGWSPFWRPHGSSSSLLGSDGDAACSTRGSSSFVVVTWCRRARPANPQQAQVRLVRYHTHQLSTLSVRRTRPRCILRRETQYPLQFHA